MAGSIKLLSFYQKLSHVIGIYPPQSNQNDQLSINSRNWLLLISLLLWGLPSAAFFVFEAKSMLEYGTSFLAASSAGFLICIYLVMIWQVKNIGPFIENCERFIEKRENSIIAYREKIEKIEWLCELVGIAAIITILLLTLTFLLYSLINYYILDLGEESFFLLYPVKWPFDWKTSLGYFVAWFAQSAGLAALVLTGITFFYFILGSCWHFIVMTKDITKDVAAFPSDTKANKNRADWMKRFCDIVQLYSDAKQCVNEFNAIVKYSLFFLIFFFMLSESSTLLTLQFQFLDENAKLFETFFDLIMALWIFGPLFLICELGERMTYQFDMFNKDFGRYDWHTLPIEMQQMYLLFLSDTQQPKNIACYGRILCIRDTFKRITNTGFSYFVTLRRFEA